MAFDAPIYSKKMERRIKLSGYSDPLADRSVKIDRNKEYSIPYTVTLPVPGTMDGGRIAAVLETDGCGNCYPFDTVDVAYISNLPTLIDMQGSLRLCWMEPKFVIAPQILNGAGEALLQFRINRYDIDLSLGNNLNEMEQMLSTLLGVVSDTLITLNRLDIYGMASADGSYAFNTTLARNRALAAKEGLVGPLVDGVVDDAVLYGRLINIKNPLAYTSSPNVAYDTHYAFLNLTLDDYGTSDASDPVTVEANLDPTLMTSDLLSNLLGDLLGGDLLGLLLSPLLETVTEVLRTTTFALDIKLPDLGIHNIVIEGGWDPTTSSID